MERLIYGAVAALALVIGTQTMGSQTSEASPTVPQKHSVQKAKPSVQQPIKDGPLTPFTSRYQNEVFVIDSVKAGQKKEGIALTFHAKLVKKAGVYHTTLARTAKVVLKTDKGTYEQPLRLWINRNHSDTTTPLLFKGAIGNPNSLSFVGILISDANGNPPMGYTSSMVPVSLQLKYGCLCHKESSVEKKG
jgi:hypothetical protein